VILGLEKKKIVIFKKKSGIIKGLSANKMSLKLKDQHLTPFHCKLSMSLGGIND